MSESSNFYNLSNAKVYQPKMRALLSLNEFDTKINEKKGLGKFQLDKLRIEEVQELMKITAVKTKNQIQKNMNDYRTIHQCHLGISPRLCLEKMKQFADQLPTIGLLPNWKDKIKKLVPQKLQKKFRESFESHLKEIESLYYDRIHEIGVNCVVPLDFNYEILREHYFRFEGRTIYRPRYLKNRHNLEKIFFYSHKLIRNIFLRAQSLLPHVICDLETYRQLGFLEPNKFFNIIDEDIDKGILIIKNTYYASIVTLVTTKRYVNDIPPKLLLQFLQAASKLMSYQIIKMLINSINHMLNILDDDLARPCIKFQLKYENNNIVIIPLKEEFYERFHMVLDRISHAGSSLNCLELWLAMKSDNELISAAVPDWFMQESHERLTFILEKLWKSLDNCVVNFQNKFEIIYNLESYTEIDQFISKEHTFEEYLKRIQDLNKIISEIDGLSENEYVEIGKIYQGGTKIGLKNHVKRMRENLIRQLLKIHQDFNHQICFEFEIIQNRALTMPKTTKELLELGQYMIYINTTFMEEVINKIKSSISNMISLMEMTNFDPSDYKLNTKTVSWLSNIKEILKQSNTLYEQTKFDLEEQLRGKINDLNFEISEIFSRLVIMNDMDDADRIREYIEDMRKFTLALEKFDEQVKWINSEESLFGFPQTVYPGILVLNKLITPFYQLIYLALKWQRESGAWLDGPMEYLDGNIIETRTAEYYAEFSKISKSFRAKLKHQMADEYSNIFTGFVDDPDPSKQPTPVKLCTQLLDNVKWFQKYLPIATCFLNPALQQRHWDEISSIVGVDVTPDAGTTLRKIINQNLTKDLDKFIEISIGASRELSFQKLFTKITQEWEVMTFSTLAYKDVGTILTQVDDVQTILEEHIVKIQMMRGSAFSKPIENDVKIFYDLLLMIQKTINEWTQVQMQWMYLLPIFSSKDIVSQLPEEGLMFEQVNKIFRDAMKSVDRNPQVKNSAGSERLYRVMKRANELLEKVNDGVINYLEKKRLFFPRFFFLSNDDMLEILSETKDPSKVQRHLKKCFEGIARLGINENDEILSMISDDKEEINFQKIICTKDAKGCVERWLIQVEEQMIKSIKHEIMMSYYDYESTTRARWVLMWPGQVVLCVSQIYWTAAVQNCFSTHMVSPLQILYENLKVQMVDMINLVRGQLKAQNRTTLNALITIDVHAQDVVKLLIEKGIVSETDFEWLAQLRYYWKDNVLIKIINATVPYAYEYLGNCSRLVITPLTDRCYRTLIGAYSLHLNGAPEGPAGTGKTETTKDLARAIAVQCVVFNCSESLDYKNMGKFFKGLASCGAWACFDEFNRIELEVLSVVAQQILCIIQAVRANLTTFVFEGTELTLNPAVYICITMNPGYAGRSELPDNLKVLFRTVAMMVPDYAMIAEIFLYSSGFYEARTLAVKIVSTFKLCSEQLSTQAHYDYGMRAVKAVLTTAQNLKSKFPDEDELVLILRSIVDVNLPKFLSHDIPLFQGIISDLFPGVNLPSPDYEMLIKALQTIADQRNLQLYDGFLLKIIQTYEMMIVRYGLMLVGGPFGGKTSVLHTLADALTLVDKWKNVDDISTIYTTINPKSISIGQLYGQFDHISSEWTDGVISKIFRKFSSDESLSRKWIIFDGPVDAVWIENLNTVLDDNKKLCLTSGEVLQMTGTMSMVFETMDLLQASPATVSRCGMIYIEPQVFNWKYFIESWYNTLNLKWAKGSMTLIKDLFEWLIDICLEFTLKKCRISLYSGQLNQFMSTLSLFQIFCDDAMEENGAEKNIESYISSWIQAAMMLAVVWGIGGTLDADSRVHFNHFCASLWKNQVETHPVPSSVAEDLISLPSEGMIYDNYYTFKGKGAWKTFEDNLKNEKVLEKLSINQIVVPTVDTLRYQYLFLKHIKHGRRFLFYGETGTGKSFYIQNIIMNKLDQKSYLPNMITFTPQTTAAETQELVINKLFRHKKNMYRPIDTSCCIVFIDDINMSAKETYGAQPAIELLRQVFDHNHWYDLKQVEKMYILDTIFICAMAPPGGSRQEIYQRFLRHFNLFSINHFSDKSILRIFTHLSLIGLKRNGFASDINTVIDEIVNATLEVFKRVGNELRPTPMKSHYLINLRDFAKVIIGCIMIRKESVVSKTTFTRLWVHETLRIFGDRLVDQKDRHWLFLQIKHAVQHSLKESFDTAFNNLPKFEGQLTEESLEDLIFGNFMNIDVPVIDRRYEEVSVMKDFEEIAFQCIEDYNLSHTTKLEIIPFKFALKHLARISRVLAIPGGSLLMIGLKGSGRQSLTRLAAHMTSYQLFQSKIGNLYDLDEWREDIKKILKMSGGTGKDVVFLFTEEQIKNEVFLSDINSLLNLGEIPNLFNPEEKQEIIEMCRLAAQNNDRNLDLSVLTILSYFVNRCKEKLHLMLCFSSIGDKLHARIRLFPSIVNCCTIDWFEVWPEEALEQVCVKFITNINITESDKINVVQACKYFHSCAKNVSDNFYRSSGRKTYVTTTTFLDLIRVYEKLMSEKQNEIIHLKDRYLNGVNKLIFAAKQIEKIKEDLQKLKPGLEESAKQTTEMMKIIEAENITVEKTMALVKKDEDSANYQAEIAKALKAECEADLAEALPVLEEALEALNILKPSDISFIKVMKNPPAGVKLVMSAICVMLQIPPDRKIIPETGKTSLDYWTPSKKLLSDIKFLEHLRNYDKDNIPEKIIHEIKKTYLSNPNFTPSVVAKASQAAQGLCKWVRAIVLYDKVAKEVAPKKAQLEIAEKDYSNILAVLEEKRQSLLELNEKLSELKTNLQTILEKKTDLENQVSNCKNQLIRAEKLISGLGNEKDRWTMMAERLQISYNTLPGDILISSGIIAYLGPFTSNYRSDCVDKWTAFVKNLNISCSDSYNFINNLGSDVEINSWNIFSLPRDSFSTENAIIMSNSKKWSLCIDPQSQANKWIRNMEKLSELEVVKLNDNYMKIIEQCIEYGKPVLIENILEELDTSLDPILMKNIYTINKAYYITCGEKVISYDPRFRLYMTTKLRNPHFLPEVYNKVTLINFALTTVGLEDQLLEIVVAKERPDLQEKREQLIVQKATNLKTLQEIEDNILKTLSTSGSKILDDEEAVEILDSLKILSVNILKKQESTKETERKIEVFRCNYKSFANYSSFLFYTLTDLPNINPMYQFSLTWFINLYIISIETANKSKILKQRLIFLRDTFTYNLYQNVSRSLFERDKLLYSFLLYTTILSVNQEIKKEEYKFFLSEGIIVGKVEENPAKDWLPARYWEEICRLDSLPSFAGFREDFKNNLNIWKQFYDSTSLTDVFIPEYWNKRLSDFQKLFIIKAVKPDIITKEIMKFIEKGLGQRFITPPTFDISKSFLDSNCLTPLIFILRPGFDPMRALANFAATMNFSSKFDSTSLGQGQGPKAQRLIEEAKGSGSWVCLQNCHLGVSWLPTLEKICEKMDTTNTNADFRLWLTSYPSEEFPISILQNSVKIIDEPPTGLQQNLLRSYTSEPVNNPEFYEGCPGKEKVFSRLLYGLCFFHALVQERRNYGAQGWNIKYEFNESDFQISVCQLKIFINDYDEIPIKAITYLTGECNYGGRVTDDRDRRCLMTILQDFYNEDIINDNSYTFLNGLEYSLPKKNDYQSYLKKIQALPSSPSPEVFGLHFNAEISRNLEISKTFFDSMMKIQGSTVVRDSYEQDEFLIKLKNDIYDKLPPLFDLDEAKKMYPVSYEESMNTVLVQEIERFNILHREIRRSLEIMEKTVLGMIVMTVEMETFIQQILNAKLPSRWMQASTYPSLKSLSGFINDFIERLNFFKKWLDHGKPSSFWISGFSFIHGFLTSVLQNFARKYQMSIDKVDLDFEVMSVYTISEAPVDGVYVYGMYLAGGRWDIDKTVLVESQPKVLWDLMPIVWLKPSEISCIKIGKRYECPLYITSARFGTLKTTGHSTNYVLMILLDTELPVSHWIKRGLALLCQLDD
ncbi:dynein heavy chain 12, axonemal [Chelonus insularis]|uniref:dynein heavy chain 12, axonemal n=1 Tax=Chelonus insularis TaxID=460826 RepID=UPI00158A82F0|nr:dynein heavy chain 12, axonemal [Chelonus insularis]